MFSWAHEIQKIYPFQLRVTRRYAFNFISFNLIFLHVYKPLVPFFSCQHEEGGEEVREWMTAMTKLKKKLCNFHSMFLQM